MEASIKYITKNYNGLTVEEVKLTKENIHKIKMELGLLDTVSKQLLTKTSKVSTFCYSFTLSSLHFFSGITWLNQQIW